VKTCVAASSLRHARAAAEQFDFDDAVGLSALLITGE
jgi:hypothetical protein